MINSKLTGFQPSAAANGACSLSILKNVQSVALIPFQWICVRFTNANTQLYRSWNRRRANVNSDVVFLLHSILCIFFLLLIVLRWCYKIWLLLLFLHCFHIQNTRGTYLMRNSVLLQSEKGVKYRFRSKSQICERLILVCVLYSFLYAFYFQCFYCFRYQIHYKTMIKNVTKWFRLVFVFLFFWLFNFSFSLEKMFAYKKRGERNNQTKNWN